MDQQGCDVRFVPKADISLSLDHVVGTGEERRRNGQSKRLGGLEIEHQLVLGRRLYGQVGGLLAFEDAIRY